jgi:hypothetical protein
MSIRITMTSSPSLDAYFTGVVGRALCHAPAVRHIIPSLRGCLATYAEPDIQAREQDGEAKNVIWFVLRATQQRYCLRYDHARGQIDLRRDGLQGPLIASFDNDSTGTHTDTVFASN